MNVKPPNDRYPIFSKHAYFDDDDGCPIVTYHEAGSARFLPIIFLHITQKIYAYEKGRLLLSCVGTRVVSELRNALFLKVKVG